MITISLNKQLDCEIYNDFKDFEVAGIDFGAGIKFEHPAISSENYKEYINLFYKDNADALNKSCDEINSVISEKQDAFYKSVNNIFGTSYRGEHFRGYISIFNCNPRFLDSNEFQVFYKKDINDKVEVVFHEILHFVFFDYCSQNLEEETSSLDRNSGKLWELSEIVNVIILNLPELNALIGREERLFYPGLKNKLPLIQDMWSKNSGMKQFILESLAVL